MDYSSISNKTACTEAEEVVDGELAERYYSLRKQHETLSNNYEAMKQELHDTRRSYQTALDVQSHLTAELESFQADEQRRRNELNIRITSLQEDISELRKERSETAERQANELKKLETEIRRLKEEQTIKVHHESPVKDNSEIEEVRTSLAQALSECDTNKQALEHSKSELETWKMKFEELLTEMGEMRAAADIRKEEMNVVLEREATALAELMEARAMLHQPADSQDLQPHAAKGNSIFAEVEDKRQEMAKNLIQMKQTNSRLRRDLANKQAELDALLHEKHTIWEQQTGAAAHYDMELIESYEERITQLEGLCERQRRELARWFGKLCEPTAQGWLPGVLDHLKSECEQLRSEVLARGAAQLSSAAQVRDLRRKLAQTAANAPKQSTTPPTKPEPYADENKENVVKFVKSRPLEDVRKKVSFN